MAPSVSNAAASIKGVDPAIYTRTQAFRHPAFSRSTESSQMRPSLADRTPVQPATELAPGRVLQQWAASESGEKQARSGSFKMLTCSSVGNSREIPENTFLGGELLTPHPTPPLSFRASQTLLFVIIP